MDIQGVQGPELKPLELQSQGPELQTSTAARTASMKAEAAGFSAAATTVGYSAPPAIAPSGARDPSLASGGILANRAVQVMSMALAVVVLGVGIWWGNGSSAVPAATGPAPAAVLIQEAQKTFAVGRVDADAKATAQLTALLKGEKTELDALTCANAPALKDLEKSSPQMAQEIKQGERVIYRVYLLDFQAEDRDRVELFVDGTSMGAVDLSNSGDEILIPILRGKPAQMKLVATSDGGGGVTVGMISSLGEARTGVLQVGQSEHWQVILK